MNKLILGFVGQIASGKGTAVEYLKEKHNASTYRFSSMLRDVLDRLYLNQSRENMQKLSSILRSNFGEDTLARVMAEDVKNDQNNLIAIDGVRRPSDVAYLKDVSGFTLVNITANMEKRFERITNRTENTDDAKKTMEEFIADHAREPEQKIAEIAASAPITIDNNGDFNELYEQLDRLIEESLRGQ
jgi:dephospho-CoA kinase